MIDTADEVWGEADLVLKVKEPVEEEYHRLRKDLVLFTYLHLAASRACTEALLAAGTTAIAYETVQLPDGSLPLLAPMSEVAGRMAPQAGAHHLQRDGGGRGVLMGGVSGVYAAKVVVIGAGVSGMNAAAIALGMQAEVLLLDRNIARLREADRIYQGHCQTVASNAYEIERAVLDADLVIGAVLVPGAKAPKLVSNELVSRMKPGSVLVDIAIDQGGCFEDSRPTTHADPVYKVHESLFYCVANMPGAVPHTSTYALTNVTLPYALEIADRGWRDALRADPVLALGLNTHDGELTYRVGGRGARPAGRVAGGRAGLAARRGGRGPTLAARGLGVAAACGLRTPSGRVGRRSLRSGHRAAPGALVGLRVGSPALAGRLLQQVPDPLGRVAAVPARASAPTGSGPAWPTPRRSAPRPGTRSPRRRSAATAPRGPPGRRNRRGCRATGGGGSPGVVGHVSPSTRQCAPGSVEPLCPQLAAMARSASSWSEWSAVIARRDR